MNHDDPTLPMPAGAAPPAEDFNAMPAEIGPYRVLNLLGEGGFGAVYLAEQTAPVVRRVALKILKPGMDSRAVVARFEAERQALAMMDHPGVATVYDAGVTSQGRPYFVMELVRGEAITAYCRQRRLPVEDRVRLMIAVCGAVQHAHIKGVVHRDLKPSNILVEYRDGGPAVKVIDFGVAKALHQPLTERPAHTEIGQLIGTPEYMSPEQARGAVLDIDTRTDVYGLGAVLYELLTGETPLRSDRLREGGFAAVGRMIEETLPERPSDRLTRKTRSGASSAGDEAMEPATVSRLLRGDLDWIVMKAIEKDRERRYPSASELAADLQRYLKHEPVSAGPPSVGYRARKFVRRNRAAVAGAAAVTGVLVLGVVGTSLGLARAVREGQRAHDEAVAASRARDEAEEVTRFLSDMLEAGTPEEAGLDVTVRQVLDRASATIAPRFEKSPLVEARLRHTIGNAYRSLGRPADADEHLSRTYELRRKEMGEDHVEALKALANVAGLRHQQGRFADAERLLRRALEGFLRSRGPDAPEVFAVLNNLAQSLRRQGRTEEASILEKQAADGYRRVLGTDHPDALGVMTNYAGSLHSDGRSAEAEAIMKDVLAGWTRAKGAEHPGTLLAQHNLALLYMDMGRMDEAETTQRQVIDARVRSLGESHHDTGTAIGNLGLILKNKGDMPAAEEAYLRGWRICRDALGPAHADTVTLATNLAEVYEAMDWPERASPFSAGLAEALRGVMQRPDATSAELNTAAWFLLTMHPESARDPRAAREAAERACDLGRGANNPNLYSYLDTLAVAQHLMGDHTAAVMTQREAIEVLPKSDEQFRGEMEQRLAEYLREAEKQ